MQLCELVIDLKLTWSLPLHNTVIIQITNVLAFNVEEETRRTAVPNPKPDTTETVFKFPSTYVFPQVPVHLTDP